MISDAVKWDMILNEDPLESKLLLCKSVNRERGRTKT